MECSEIVFACLQLFFTGVICYSTWKYTNITSKTLEEIRKEREYRETPDINIRFKEESDGTHTLEFKNVSKSEIFNLKIDVENADNIRMNRNYKLSDFGFIKNKIKYMGVNQVYEIKNITMYDFVNKHHHLSDLNFQLSYYSKYDQTKTIFKNIDFNLSQFENTVTEYNI